MDTDGWSKFDWAIYYATGGWSVFPVCSPGADGKCREGHYRKDRPTEYCTGKNIGKTPLVAWKHAQEYVASEETIQAWWGTWPHANIGLATGRVSGVCVIDIDGELAQRQAEKLGLPTNGPAVNTGREGGQHIYCKWREDAPTVFAKANGIDFRGEGGYVVLPPSRHYTGTVYDWARGLQDVPVIPDLPMWINELAVTNRQGEHRNIGHVDIGKLFKDGIPEGERDTTLFRVAAKLRAVDVPQDVALGVLLCLADRCNPPFPLDETERKVDSAYKRYQPSSARYEPVESVDPNPAPVVLKRRDIEVRNMARGTSLVDILDY